MLSLPFLLKGGFMNKKSTTQRKKRETSFKLPKYLRLAKGSMWFDTEGDNASGIKLFAVKDTLVSRPFKMVTVIDNDGKELRIPEATDVPKDNNKNENTLDFGKISKDLEWYVDTAKIPQEKLSRILLAYKHGILVEADPESPPGQQSDSLKRDFTVNERGERIFVGKNKEMYRKLQNLPFKELQSFVRNCPKTRSARENLQDMYEYEVSGHNPLARPRLEVLDLIKNKLKEYGPGISAIRINEDEDEG